MTVDILSSERIFQGRVFAVRRDTVRFEDGRETIFDLVEHNGSVTIIPIDEQDRLWFVRQYRHPVGDTVLEFPAGTLQGGEDPVQCARRECREEIGMQPGELLVLSSVFLAPGYSTERSHLFLASDLNEAPLPTDRDEDIETVPIPLEDVYDLIAEGGLQDAKTLCALLLALPIVDA